MEKAIDFCFRTEGAAGSVAPTIDSNGCTYDLAERYRLMQPISRTRHSIQQKRAADGCPFCRGEATRTPDPHVPNVVRYQLRYSSKASAKVLLFSHLSKQSKKKHTIFSENCVSISFLWALVSSMHEHLLQSKAIYLLSWE